MMKNQQEQQKQQNKQKKEMNGELLEKENK